MKAVRKVKHIKIKYSFVTNKVKDKETKITYCPTEGMLVDFYTKTYKGAIFIQHRNAIMGIDQEDIPMYGKHFFFFIKTISIESHKRHYGNQQE